MAGCGRAPGFLKLFYEKCVCMYVCMYICLSFRIHVSKPFTWSLKAACIQTIKAKQSLHYTHAQVSSPSKTCFFPIRKRPSADFKASFPSRLFRRPTTEKQLTRPHEPPGNAHLMIWKVGVTHIYVNEMKSSLKALLEEFQKNNMMERL